jgi:hypothetical protein
MSGQIRANSFGKLPGKHLVGLFAVIAALVLATGIPSLWAGVGGSISGRVTDPSGTVIPGAGVVATK